MHAIAPTPSHLIPIVGQPGTAAMISTLGAEESYTSMAGPTWRNEVCARATLEVSYNRPVTFAKNVKCPTLIKLVPMTRLHHRPSPKQQV
jgi:hypothetical protein